MSRRGHAASDVYEERDREYYAPRRSGGRTVEYDEVDIRERRRESGRQPDFLKDDYGRSSNVGELVVRERKTDDVSRERPRPKDVVRETDEQIYIHKGGREPDRPKHRSEDVRTDVRTGVRTGVRTDRSEVGSYRRPDSPETDVREEIVYRDRERDYPPPRQQVAREREEFVFRERERERDYGPPPVAPQPIAREREEFVFRPKPREPDYESEEITIRKREREPERPRDFREEEIIIRNDERERVRPRQRDRYDEQEEIIIRRDERERERPRDRDRYDDDEEIIIRRGESDRLRPRARSYERESLSVSDDRSIAPRAKSRDYREEDITSRRSERERVPRARSRDTKYSEEDIIIRRDEREPRRVRSRSRDVRQDELVIRRSSYSRERERPRARSRGRGGDEEDIIIRHDEGRKGHKDEVIIRRNERSPSVDSYRSPLEPEPVRAPPIHQEIITHHRHIDHGFESAPRARSPPRRRSPSPKDDFQQIEIRRRGSRNGRAFDEDIVIDSGPPAHRGAAHRRSPSPVRSHFHSRSDELDIAEEADYYNARAAERSYIGEGYHGATRDWAIVDVPPGTKRVHMEGVGGAKEDITWARYNGVRRSKFIADDDDYGPPSRDERRGARGAIQGGERELDIAIRDSGHRGGDHELDVAIRDNRGPEREQDDWGAGRRYIKQEDKKERMWTEITKDLVSIDAIKEMGYEYEETEFFYYVFKYLKYEEVQALTDLSTEIKYGRRSRIRQIEAEREAEAYPPAPRRKALGAPPGWDEERVVEREIIYNDGPPRRGYR